MSEHAKPQPVLADVQPLRLLNRDQVLQTIDLITWRIHGSPDAAVNLADTFVTEMVYETAYFLVDTIGFDWPPSNTITVDDVVSFIGKAGFYLVGNSEEQIALAQAFGNDAQQLNEFLLKGLEVLVAEKTDQFPGKRSENLRVLQQVAALTGVQFKPTDEHRLRRLLRTQPQVRHAITPDSNVEAETLAWLSELSDEALENPTIQALLFAGESRHLSALLPHLGRDGVHIVTRQDGVQHLGQVLLPSHQIEKVKVFLQENSQLALGLLLAMLDERTTQYLRAAIVLLWNGNSPQATIELLNQMVENLPPQVESQGDNI